MRHERITMNGSREALAPEDITVDLVRSDSTLRAGPAVPDFPAVIGRLIVAAYTTLLATFAITMAHSREALFAMAICAVFLIMFLAIPRIFFAVEPKHGKRPSFETFLCQGVETCTGHCSGKDALLQMLLVPVSLTFCALAMGIVSLVVR